MVMPKTLYGYPVVVTEVIPKGKTPEIHLAPTGATWVFPCRMCSDVGTHKGMWREEGKPDKVAWLCDKCYDELKRDGGVIAQ